VMRYVASTSGITSVEQCLAEMHNQSLFLVLDGVQDPHNLGACLRTANGAGVDAVIIPKDRSAKLNATVSKVAAGAAESTPLLEVTNISRCLKDLKNAGVSIYGTSGDANDSLYDFNYQNPVALVMGSEGDGLRRLTMEQCDHLLKLPMQGSVESLNVSVATGVCLYEIMRSRMACS
jgi:23S rRNA (guanosine2251-2'-O)-methyltransferase